MPKSGLNFKHNILGLCGVIDADYTGEVKARLFNYGKEPYTFEEGDAVSQLVVVPFVQLDGYEVMEQERGEKGFGECDK